MTIFGGPMLSSLPRGCSPWLQPVASRANLAEETTDWRAVCGRTVRTVRRAGTAIAVPAPYQAILNFQSDDSRAHRCCLQLYTRHRDGQLEAPRPSAPWVDKENSILGNHARFM